MCNTAPTRRIAAPSTFEIRTPSPRNAGSATRNSRRTTKKPRSPSPSDRVAVSAGSKFIHSHPSRSFFLLFPFPALLPTPTTHNKNIQTALRTSKCASSSPACSGASTCSSRPNPSTGTTRRAGSNGTRNRFLSAYARSEESTE